MRENRNWNANEGSQQNQDASYSDMYDDGADSDSESNINNANNGNTGGGRKV